MATNKFSSDYDENDQESGAFDDDEQGSDEFDDDGSENSDQDEDEDEEAPAPRKGGRPVLANPKRRRTASGFSVTAVFKDEVELQEFQEEASVAGLSNAAYAMRVIKNRHNTTEGASDRSRQYRALKERVLQLEGAKEQLQALYEQALAGKNPEALAGLEPAGVPITNLTAAVKAEIKRMETERLAKEAPELQKKLDALQKEFEDLEDQYEKETSLMAKATMIAPAALNGLLARAPGLAVALGGLMGIDPGTPMGLPAGPSADSTDPLVLAVLRTRDNVSPKQARELEVVMDGLARFPNLVTNFSDAVKTMENAQQQKQQSGFGPG